MFVSHVQRAVTVRNDELKAAMSFIEMVLLSMSGTSFTILHLFYYCRCYLTSSSEDSREYQKLAQEFVTALSLVSVPQLLHYFQPLKATSMQAQHRLMQG